MTIITIKPFFMLALTAFVSFSALAANHTNVLFIAIDDLKPILGCYGNRLVESPRMDALAERGMLFENAHCALAVCGPSRASVMTSLMPEQHGVLFFQKMRDGLTHLHDVVTLPQHFKNNGYETAATGKVNDYRCVGSINPDDTVNSDGAQVDDPPSWSIPYVEAASGITSSTAIRTGSTDLVKRAAESVDAPDSAFWDGKICEEGLTLMDMLAAGDKPFFLAVGFNKPHLPFLAPKAYWDLYDRDNFEMHPFQTNMLNSTAYTFTSPTREVRDNYYLELNGSGEALAMTLDILPEAQQKELMHGYYACTSFIDAQVGRLLDHLDALGLSSNTIVVLWGDHGFHLGDHNLWGKHSYLEQATHLPLIIAAPGMPAGKTSSMAGLIDLYPTLCDLAGLAHPQQPLSSTNPTGRPLAGKSLVPVLQDPAVEVQVGTMTQYRRRPIQYAYRTRRYRYVEMVNNNGSTAARELYDYEADPLETENLAVYPEYQALMYQFSRSMRSANECGGCELLHASPAMAAPADKTLVGLGITGSSTNLALNWPNAADSTYTIFQKTNLTDTAWSTNSMGVAASPLMLLPGNQSNSFYRVELGN